MAQATTSTTPASNPVSALDQSNEVIGRILALLIESGLARRDIRLVEVFPGPDDESLDHQYHQFMSIADWLRDEGLIRFQRLFPDGIISGAQLTSRGLVAIGQKHDNATLSVRQTIEQAKEPLAPRDYSRIGDFIGGLLGGITKSMSGG